MVPRTAQFITDEGDLTIKGGFIPPELRGKSKDYNKYINFETLFSILKRE